MERKQVLGLIPVQERHKEQLEAAAPFCTFHFTSHPADHPDWLAQAQIILGNLPVELVRRAERLEWLQLNSAGADNYLRPGTLPAHVRLTTASGAYGPAVSEHMLAMLFTLQKKLHFYRDNQNQGRWRDEGVVLPLHGQTVLVVGLGDIGRAFAQKMNVLGNHVIGIRRDVSHKPDYIEKLASMDALESYLPQADTVFFCLPSTPETRNLMDGRRLALLKKTAILLNGGRGDLIDSEALYRALAAGTFYGAGLDVTDPEPLPADHPLWRLPNVLITPHVAGWYHLPETLDHIVDIMTENLIAYQQGKPLRNRAR